MRWREIRDQKQKSRVEEPGWEAYSKLLEDELNRVLDLTVSKRAGQRLLAPDRARRQDRPLDRIVRRNVTGDGAVLLLSRSIERQLSRLTVAIEAEHRMVKEVKEFEAELELNSLGKYSIAIMDRQFPILIEREVHILYSGTRTESRP